MEKRQRINMFTKICYYGIFITLFLLVAAISISNFYYRENTEYIPGIGPYKLLIILSDSMKPVFAAGDVIIVDASGGDGYREGDIITFWRSRNPQVLLTHRVAGIEEIAERTYYNTRGDASNTEDGVPVRQEETLGRYLFKIPYGGHVVQFVHTRLGFALLVVLPFILVGLNGLRGHLKKRREKSRPSSLSQEVKTVMERSTL